jgi:hypothetical protein
MSEDRFFDRLRDDAAQLRYTPQDDVLWTRLGARVRSGIAAQPGVADMLARWFRPITASFIMLALVAALGVTWVERRDMSGTNETIGTNSLEIAVDGDTYTLAE